MLLHTHTLHVGFILGISWGRASHPALTCYARIIYRTFNYQNVTCCVCNKIACDLVEMCALWFKVSTFFFSVGVYSRQCEIESSFKISRTNIVVSCCCCFLLQTLNHFCFFKFLPLSFFLAFDAGLVKFQFRYNFNDDCTQSDGHEKNYMSSEAEPTNRACV